MVTADSRCPVAFPPSTSSGCLLQRASGPRSLLCRGSRTKVPRKQAEVGEGQNGPVSPKAPLLPAQKPKVSENDFEDLLSNQGFSSKSDRKGPRTMAEMRKQDLARDTDPLKLKVGAGTSGPGPGGQLATTVGTWVLVLLWAAGWAARDSGATWGSWKPGRAGAC